MVKEVSEGFYSGVMKVENTLEEDVFLPPGEHEIIFRNKYGIGACYSFRVLLDSTFEVVELARYSYSDNFPTGKSAKFQVPDITEKPTGAPTFAPSKDPEPTTSYPTDSLTLSPTSLACSFDVDLDCRTSDDRACDSIGPRQSSQCAVGSNIEAIAFSIQDSTCVGERPESTCLSLTGNVTVNCGNMNVSPSTLSPGEIFTVTRPGGGSLPDEIMCTISDTIGGNSIQNNTIDTSGDTPLKLGDRFGALELKSCDDLTCIEVLLYETSLRNIATGPLLVTLVEIYLEGNILDLASQVESNPLSPGQSTSVTFQNKVDVCTVVEHYVEVNAEAELLSGATCEESDAYAFSTAPLPPSPPPIFPPVGAPTLLPTAEPTAFQLVWTSKEIIKGDEQGSQFAESLASSEDGLLVVVSSRTSDVNGAENAGRVQVFSGETDRYKKVGQDLTGSRPFEYFGSAVAVSGSNIAVSSPFGTQQGSFGNVKVFTLNGEKLVQLGSDLSLGLVGDEFGASLAMTNDGLLLAVGAPFANKTDTQLRTGAVRVFELVEAKWVELGQILEGRDPFEQYGRTVSLCSSNGDVMLIISSLPTSGRGRVETFRWQGEWVSFPTVLTGNMGDDFGASTACSISNSESSSFALLAVASPLHAETAGSVRMFELGDGSSWTELDHLVVGSEGDRLGTSLSFGNEDSFLLTVGAPQSGTDSAGYVRILDATNGRPVGNLLGVPGETGFGVSVALSSERLAVGATPLVSSVREDVGSVAIHQYFLQK